jgi:hypothetical protein
MAASTPSPLLNKKVYNFREPVIVVDDNGLPIGYDTCLHYVLYRNCREGKVWHEWSYVVGDNRGNLAEGGRWISSDRLRMYPVDAYPGYLVKDSPALRFEMSTLTPVQEPPFKAKFALGDQVRVRAKGYVGTVASVNARQGVWAYEVRDNSGKQTWWHCREFELERAEGAVKR